MDATQETSTRKKSKKYLPTSFVSWRLRCARGKTSTKKALKLSMIELISGHKHEDYTQQYREGKIQIEESNDILTMALGNPEQSGRIRGMGKHVTQSQFFHTPPPSRKLQFNLKQWQAKKEKKMEQILKEQRENFQAKINEIRAVQQSRVGGSNTTPRSRPEVQGEYQRKQTHMDVEAPQAECQREQTYVDVDICAGMSTQGKKNRPCKLAVGSRDNIVAIEHIQDSLDRTLLHRREIGESNYRISIEIAFNHNAPLPIPNLDDPDILNVGLVLRSHVA
ncbi:hypothetical protein TorRG33x02_191490 [Trema orientale]|uniref:Transposase, Ptta/En/Spm, plant n=1 Tax=Trema orientale TaxID=63057 RepID=A0A2P5EHP4_TREOI|nr:hypothetical protein TorRG33x02_191490 [Trema orientale]